MLGYVIFQSYMCVLRHIYSEASRRETEHLKGSHSSPISVLDRPLVLQDLKAL